MLKQVVPDAFWDAILRALIKQNRDAHKKCTDAHEPSEVHDLYPAVRRAMFEQSFRDVARLHGAEVRTEPNSHGGANHSEVRWRNVVLTQSRADGREVLPPKAVFRQTLAQGSQRDFFMADEIPSAASHLYGVLTHGKPKNPKTGVPTFVSVLFPDSANEAILDSIDLTTRLHAAMKNVAAEEDTEKRELKVAMRKQRKSKQKGSA
jgi:hypothetical protein